MTLGQRLRQRRQYLSKNLADIAAVAGISIPYLSELERDNAAPPLNTLISLATALQTTVVHLLNGVEGLGEFPTEMGWFIQEAGGLYQGRGDYQAALCTAMIELQAARQALADAAHEINCSGPVAHRIRVLKTHHAEQIARLEAQLEERKTG